MRHDLGLNALRCFVIWAFVGFVAFAADAPAPVAVEPSPFLSPLLSDNMVMQRGKPNTFWGWTEPGQMVRVTVNGKTAETRAGADRKWSVAVEPPPAGGPYEVIIEGPQQVVLKNVLVGDVWFASGQSNMGVAVNGSRNAKEGAYGAEDVKAADLPQIRFFSVPQATPYVPSESTRGQWRVSSPTTAGAFSAVAFYFGRKLHRELGVPIGLITSAVGGTPAESYISPKGVASTGEFGPQLAEIDRLHQSGAREIGSFLLHWLPEYDLGAKNNFAWAQPDFADGDWTPVEPKTAADKLGVGQTPNLIWYRREVQLPDPLPAGAARILLGQVYEMESTYFNGVEVGNSSWQDNPRSYTVPPNLLKPGRNVIAVRVYAEPGGGFIDAPAALALQFGGAAGRGGRGARVGAPTEPPAPINRMPLDTGWKAKVSVDGSKQKLPFDHETLPTMPTVLYNGMIHPVTPLAITGAIWYQGEANAPRPDNYQKLLTALIGSWRESFRQPNMPVYVVSLPAYYPHRDTPGSDGWTQVRDAQIKTTRVVPNTGTAITVDVGDAANLHPTDKKPVGERLAALALAQHYKKNVPSAGPTFTGFEKTSGGLRLKFEHAEGLESRGEKVGEFAIAGADRVWHWADAKIEGSAIVVSSREVSNPVAVRYAWQANPIATLFNGAGFPAVPFRTDDWPLTGK